MGKLRIEHGISRIKRAKLQTYIDQTIANDIALMAEWTNNEQSYVVNELLRFALSQSEEFQKFRAERGSKSSSTASETKSLPPKSYSASDSIALGSKAETDTAAKPTPSQIVTANRA